MIDLHLHTDYSDGIYPPKELLSLAVKAGCDFISITDHDNIRAINEIFALLETGHNDIKYITGMEMDAVFNGLKLHILCYNFDHNSECIKNLFKHVALLKREYKARLNENIISSCADEMEKAKYKPSAEFIIENIHNAGGFVSLAHPIKLQNKFNMSLSALDLFTGELKDKGLDCIEAYHSLHDADDVKNYLEIAEKYRLKVTAGSDYHGINRNYKYKTDVNIGKVTSYDLTLDSGKFIKELL